MYENDVYGEMNVKIKIISNTNNIKALDDFKKVNNIFNKINIKQTRSIDTELRYNSSILDFFNFKMFNNISHLRILGMPVLYSPSLKIKIARLLYKKFGINILNKIFKLDKMNNIADICYILNLNMYIVMNIVSYDNRYYSYYIEFDSIDTIVRHYQIPNNVFDKF